MSLSDIDKPFLGTRSRMEPRGDINTVKEAEALTSIAISLKRIADGLWGTDDTSGLLQLLNPLDVRSNY